jgi:choline dehydrogenase
MAEATGVAISQAFASPADVFGSDLAEIANSTRDELPRWADQIVAASGSAGALLNKSAVETVLRAQHDLVFGDGATTLVEYVTQIIGGDMLVTRFWTLYTFSRGSVHLASANVSKINEPRLDPRFNLVDFDVATQIRNGKLAERLWKTEALSPLASGRIQPSLDVLPEDATEAQWREFIKTTCEPI